jgi:hypothetical protein
MMAYLRSGRVVLLRRKVRDKFKGKIKVNKLQNSLLKGK